MYRIARREREESDIARAPGAPRAPTLPGLVQAPAPGRRELALAALVHAWIPAGLKPAWPCAGIATVRCPPIFSSLSRRRRLS